MFGRSETEARRWFQQALYDLRAVRWNLEGEFFDTACFLAQQAGEKALKSVLYFLGARRSALLTYSLASMVDEISNESNSFRPLSRQARTLDLHYIPSRYPNGLPDGIPHQFYDRTTGTEAAEAAEEIVKTVEKFYKARKAKAIYSEDPGEGSI